MSDAVNADPNETPEADPVRRLAEKHRILVAWAENAKAQITALSTEINSLRLALVQADEQLGKLPAVLAYIAVHTELTASFNRGTPITIAATGPITGGFPNSLLQTNPLPDAAPTA